MDRLNDLPDDLIFHIISFLPIKSCMRTGILAKGWRFKWAHVPGLGFTCNEYCGECRRETKMIHSNITTNLNVFHRGFGTSQHDFESWIVTVFARNVRNLLIDLSHQFKLPQSLFTCETLVYLRIVDCDGIPDNGTVHFPALKKLELVSVGYDSEESLGHLLSGCPVIEELMIERMKAVCCDIHMLLPNLTRLVIDIDEVIFVRLKLPKVEYLRICVRMNRCIFAWPILDSLIEADIDLTQESNNIYSYFLIKFVAVLYNVKLLTLSTSRLEVPDSQFNDLVVKFHNLIELNLRADWRFITLLLENADNLRVLTILPVVDHKSIPYWMEPKQVPACLVSHLEKVNLVDFGWSTEHEFEMVKYVMKNAKVMEEMKIVCSPDNQLDSKVKFEAINRIAMLEIGSRTCHLTFVSFV